MEELAVHQFDRVSTLFEKVRIYRAMPLAVIDGKQRGRIFVNDPIRPLTALVYNVAGITYLAGSADNASFNQSLPHVLFEELRHEMGSCMVLASPADWERILADLSDDRIHMGDDPVVSFTFDPDTSPCHPDWAARIPSDFDLQPITADLVDDLGSHFPVFETWQSPESFLSSGFGAYFGERSHLFRFQSGHPSERSDAGCFRMG